MTTRALPFLQRCATLLACGLAACGGGDSPSSSLPSESQLSSALRAPSAAWHPPSLRERALAASDGGYAIDTTQRDAVRLFHRAVYLSSENVAVGWTGSVARCDVGTSSAEHRAATLRRINWTRAMAGVPAAVVFDDEYSRKAQLAALVMAANGQLSHTPPSNWLCWSADAATGAGNSNLALGRSNGPDSISAGYLADPGSNNAPVGHRRNLLYPQTRVMGSGDVQGVDASIGSNALWVFDDAHFGPRPAVRDGFVAWPAPGYVPHTSVFPRWSLSYPDADFSAASVRMTENGASLATRLEPLSDGFGENTLVWLPGAYSDGMSWARPAADTVYEVNVQNVRIGGVARTFSYRVTVFDADDRSPWGTGQGVQGSTTLPAGQAAPYSFDAVAGAQQYQWRVSPLAAYTLADGAEAGSGNFSATTSPGYPLIASDVAASGSRSFHLAQTLADDQVLLLRQAVVPRSDTQLSFASRLGLASTNQHALVEVSVDDGRSWTMLYDQAGRESGSAGTRGETSFTTRTLSLAAYAGRSVQLRWRYAKPQGSYYPQADTGAGWYLDDIRIDIADSFAAAGTVSESVQPQQTLALPAAGRWLVQSRPGLYGLFAEWSTGLAVAASSASPARTDCLFDWAQRNYPTLFKAGSQTAFSAPYTYRAYAGPAYLGVSSLDDHVYYLAGGVLSDVGPQGPWLAKAGCN